MLSSNEIIGLGIKLSASIVLKLRRFFIFIDVKLGYRALHLQLIILIHSF